MVDEGIWGGDSWWLLCGGLKLVDGYFQSYFQGLDQTEPNCFTGAIKWIKVKVMK